MRARVKSIGYSEADASASRRFVVSLSMLPADMEGNDAWERAYCVGVGGVYHLIFVMGGKIAFWGEGGRAVIARATPGTQCIPNRQDPSPLPLTPGPYPPSPKNAPNPLPRTSGPQPPKPLNPSPRAPHSGRQTPQTLNPNPPNPPKPPQEIRTDGGATEKREPYYVTDAEAKRQAGAGEGGAADARARAERRAVSHDRQKATLPRRPIEHPLWRHELWSEVGGGRGVWAFFRGAFGAARAGGGGGWRRRRLWFVAAVDSGTPSSSQARPRINPYCNNRSSLFGVPHKPKQTSTTKC